MRSYAVVLVGVLIGGCAHPSAVTDTASDIQRKVTPAAHKIAERSQRLVRAAGRAADDAALAAKVRGVLLTRRGLDAEGIAVKVRRGTVSLSGSVSSAAQKREAGELARETAGVTGVTNRLTIRQND